jgi:hypothetical protein
MMSVDMHRIRSAVRRGHSSFHIRGPGVHLSCVPIASHGDVSKIIRFRDWI